MSLSGIPFGAASDIASTIPSITAPESRRRDVAAPAGGVTVIAPELQGEEVVLSRGRDEAGIPMRTGLYFTMLSTPKVRKVARLLLLRKSV